VSLLLHLYELLLQWNRTKQAALNRPRVQGTTGACVPICFLALYNNCRCEFACRGVWSVVAERLWVVEGALAAHLLAVRTQPVSCGSVAGTCEHVKLFAMFCGSMRTGSPHKGWCMIGPGMNRFGWRWLRVATLLPVGGKHVGVLH
jgi:hypothetical protein